jgi:hypothetical protein
MALGLTKHHAARGPWWRDTSRPAARYRAAPRALTSCRNTNVRRPLRPALRAADGWLLCALSLGGDAGPYRAGYSWGDCSQRRSPPGKNFFALPSPYWKCPHMCRFLGHLHDVPLDALTRQASGKCQGTKSRSGWDLVLPLLLARSGIRRFL